MFRKLKNWKYGGGRDVVTTNLIQKGWPRPEADIIAVAMCPIAQERPPISPYLREALEREAKIFHQHFGQVWPDPGTRSANWTVEHAIRYLKRYRDLARQNHDEFYEQVLTACFAMWGLETFEEDDVEDEIQAQPAQVQRRRSEPLRADRSGSMS